MSDQLVTSVVTIATGLIGVAIVAVLVSQKANTGSVIQAATSGFASDLSAATSPFSGGGSSFSGFTGGSLGSLNYQ